MVLWYWPDLLKRISSNVVADLAKGVDKLIVSMAYHRAAQARSGVTLNEEAMKVQPTPGIDYFDQTKRPSLV